MLKKLLLILIVCAILASCQRTYYEQTAISCLLLNEAQGQEFIIQNEQDYQQLNAYRHTTGRCVNNTLPPLYFDGFTLLGKVITVEACSATFKNKVTINHKDKQATYIIRPILQGDCNMKTIVPNWMIVEKIPDDYTISFRVEQ